MVTNKKTTDLIKKIILLLILVFFSNLFYLYFKKNQKEPFVYNNYKTSIDVSAADFLSNDIESGKASTVYGIIAPRNNNIIITSLTRAVNYALNTDSGKNFTTSQGKPKQFPINTIVEDQKSVAPLNCDDSNEVECMYQPNKLAFGYGTLPLINEEIPASISDIRIDKDTNIYLDNYDQIDKIIERENIDKNYTEKTLNDNTDISKDKIYKLRNTNKGTINRRGAVEVAYTRKEELENTKTKYNTENIRNYSINLQYILLFSVILISIIVLGLYSISLISNIALIIYIILVTLVIYFFNIINIIN
tara:strand:- start:227 stop:1141 length:915 start_codon:yes stop_codon:yes gene_type:complete